MSESDITTGDLVVSSNGLGDATDPAGTIILFEGSSLLKAIGVASQTVFRAGAKVTEVASKVTNAVKITMTSFHDEGSRVAESAEDASNVVLEQGRAVNEAAEAAIKTIREAAINFTAATEQASRVILNAGRMLDENARTTSATFSTEIEKVTKEATQDIDGTTATLNAGRIKVKVTLSPDSDLSKSLIESDPSS